MLKTIQQKLINNFPDMEVLIEETTLDKTIYLFEYYEDYYTLETKHMELVRFSIKGSLIHVISRERFYEKVININDLDWFIYCIKNITWFESLDAKINNLKSKRDFLIKKILESDG